MQIKLSNFKAIAKDYAEVDVEITKGFWPFKTKHIESRKICALNGQNWFFLDTGEFTPDYQAERLYRTYVAKENLQRIQQAEADINRTKTFEKLNNDGKEYEALEKIRNWINAYPLEVFPEPDMKLAHETLKAAGISLDAISASNMRYILNGIKKIVDEAIL